MLEYRQKVKEAWGFYGSLPLVLPELIKALY